MIPVSTLPQPTKNKRKISGWSDERRARHATAVRSWAPWAKSTGPRTVAGKNRSAMNALKHGLRTKGSRAMRAALARQDRFLRKLTLYARLKQKNLANELLKDWRDFLRKEGREVTITLVLASVMVEIEDRFLLRPSNDA